MATKKDNTSADMSVEQKLKNLYSLQTKLSEIDEIKTLRGELPLEVQDLEDEIEGLSHRLHKYEEEIEHIKGDIAHKHESIKEAQEMMTRYQSQLDDVRNNREYDNLSKEIEFQSLEIELLRKKINDAERLINLKTGDLEKGRAALESRQQDLDQKKAELDEIVADTKADEEKLREKAKAIETTIEPRLLTAFKRIRQSSRNGLGIVYVQRDACGGCFNKIPPQRQLDIRMRKKIIVCEYCGRIMIDPELAGVKIERPEEKPKRRVSRRKKTEETEG
ncbi:zinc ribbon domain-containing protein [Alloprevotella sp. oral taxon 473]|jgi:putative zinc ribbon domain protein|uniref:zinc ribbon domain-containing protein n=1 Tax=Alloprevotella sp. oral taxon 473 TaxID=712469 RepID=UPI0002A1A484|nr:C4-type zinc ribbon domain-containing protein [Alloprevotella sp. oral taxon 473]EKX94328.1 zinc ribbon domain protein [Alloprevotella sp. oral taxon 473 str. F0040]